MPHDLTNDWRNKLHGDLPDGVCHDLPNDGESRRLHPRAEIQVNSLIEFPDELEEGILIWPSERDFWRDEPLQLILSQQLRADLAQDLAQGLAQGAVGRRSEDHGAEAARNERSLAFRLLDLKGELHVPALSCGLVCHFQISNRRWQFEISFEGQKNSAFVRDALDAVEQLQMNQESFTAFAEAFGLIGLGEAQISQELGAHLFFP